ncbi:MAG: winged helix DNA-binding domain-containing protein [Acidimicrobiales bacterium]
MRRTGEVSDGDRRALVGTRHRLAPPARAAGAVEVAAALVGLHATDAASVYLSVAARSRHPELAAVDTALYDDRTLVRVLGMRRTMFVVPAELAPVVHGACTVAIAARERRHLVRQLEQAGAGADCGRLLRQAEAETLAVLAERGSATAAELSAAVPTLRRTFSFGEGTRWAGTQGLSTRVLFLLSADGHIVRGRPRGSWVSTAYRWSPTEAWLGRPLTGLAPADARAELARRWLASYGPAAAADLKWWAGWTVAEARAALAAAGAVEVDLAPGPGVAAAGEEHPAAPPASEPWAALLPSLDPTVMGWHERDWYLGSHRPLLFDRSGNAGPTVWWDGRVVGGWAQRAGGEVRVRLLHDVGADGRAAVAAEADRLQRLLGHRRVTPRFRTPLERELSA